MELSPLGSNLVSNMQSNSNVKNAKNAGLHTCDYDLTFDNFKFESCTPVRSPQFYAENNRFVKWSFAIELLKYEIGNGFDDASLQLKAMTINKDETEQHYQYGGEVVFYLRSNTRKITCKGEFTYNEAVDVWATNEEKLVCLLRLSNEGYRSLSFEEDTNFKLRCEIRYIKLNDVIPLYTSPIPVNTAPLEPYPLEDYEKLYLSEDYSDVTICIKIDDNFKEYPAHKNILSVRSKVFEAMFKHDMIENKLNRVVVEDIKEEVFLEILRYIYANKVQNLDTLVYELLPVADRYDLERLKIICGKVLMEELSVETVLGILKLADTYNVGDLKIKAMQFIRINPNFFKNMESTAWKDLLSRPQLIKDILIKMNLDDDEFRVW